MKADALMSPCGAYRYWLTRTWDATRPSVCFIMLNPSTADAARDDPTIRRCVGFGERWGCGGVHVVNLFALRATDPKALRAHADPVGPENDEWIRRGVRGRAVVAAWGASPLAARRARDVLKLTDTAGVWCLGVTRDGHPRHPLYVPNDAPLVPINLATPRSSGSAMPARPRRSHPLPLKGTGQ
jgi:hypothetical protein